MIWLSLIAFAVSFLSHFVPDRSPTPDTCSGPEQLPPKVSSILTGVSAHRLKDEWSFQCDVQFQNDTGKELLVKSRFSSAFDGLELVITNKEGKTLIQQGYTWHLGPGELREHTLKPGITKATLVFLVGNMPKNLAGELPNDIAMVKVRLVGTLPGGDYERIISTETIELDLTKAK